MLSHRFTPGPRIKDIPKWNKQATIILQKICTPPQHMHHITYIQTKPTLSH